MAGLEPAIHGAVCEMDGRVKPAHDMVGDDDNYSLKLPQPGFRIAPHQGRQPLVLRRGLLASKPCDGQTGNDNDIAGWHKPGRNHVRSEPRLRLTGQEQSRLKTEHTGNKRSRNCPDSHHNLPNAYAIARYTLPVSADSSVEVSSPPPSPWRAWARSDSNSDRYASAAS